ncbi:MAG TPA: hypothetical protein EYO33_13790 [Phycisphaerales bacterium]|nr:hypothetical protein [Phycisphaerales bacterium]
MTSSKSIVFDFNAAGGPFHDPALLVTVSNHRDLILFDCGTLTGLKTRDLQRVRWLCLSHLHIDHLIGFDHLLRVRLFSDLPLTVFGPPGTTAIIGHRLQGYAWNLTSGSPFIIQAFDLPNSPDQRLSGASFRCHHQFKTEPMEEIVGFPHRMDEGLSLFWQPVDHGVPCYCYKLEKQFPPKFSPEIAESLGLRPGPWVKRLISEPDFQMLVDGIMRERVWLAERLLQPPERRSLGYLTDSKLELPLVDELQAFFAEVDHLICESAYLASESDLARQNLHMTTTQVAHLASAAKVGELHLFHLSRRHMENGPEKHLQEVQEIFPSARLLTRKKNA